MSSKRSGKGTTTIEYVMVTLLIINIIISTAIILYVYTAKPEAGRPEILRIANGPFIETTTKANVIKLIMENYMDYEVKITDAEFGACFAAVATYDADMVDEVWLPSTHADYWASYKDQCELLGPVFEGGGLFWTVPAYVTVDSIEQLNEFGDKFGWNFYGIDPGTGINRLALDVIEQYELNFQLVEGSVVAMATELGKAIEDNRWIVVGLWQPHWAYARWGLKNLEDPKGILGGTEDVYFMVNQHLKEDQPDAYEFLSKVYFGEETYTLVYWVEVEKMTEEDAALKWYQEKKDIWYDWLPDKYKT